MAKQTKDSPTILNPLAAEKRLNSFSDKHRDHRNTQLPTISSDKKVVFLDTVQYSPHLSPSIKNDNNGKINPDSAIQEIRASAKLLPRKGILKSNDRYTSVSLANMLQSHLKALAGNDIYSRKDAYINLSYVIMAFDNVPDFHLLMNNMSEICRYIWRDLSTVGDDGELNPDFISQVLNFLISFQHNPSISEGFPIKFQFHVVEYAISILEKPSTPGVIVRKILFILAHQKFHPKVIISETFGDLIKKLHVIGEKKSSKKFITGRMEIYQNLLKNSKSIMVIHTMWIQDLLCDMNSSLKDIRSPAIKFGFLAAVELGAESSVSNTLFTLFRSKLPGGEQYGSAYTQMLIRKTKEDYAETVPQIWSILVLLQRHRPQALAQTSYIKSLLAVLSVCFNQKDQRVQKEALYAWNRFIFVVRLSENSPKSLRDTLIRPFTQSILYQKPSRIFESLFNLLYYAFRPGCSAAQLDLYWDEYVKELIFQSLRSRKSNIAVERKNADVATQILVNLFDVKTSRRWTENKAVESLGSNQVMADELPPLDSKWLRKSSARIFSVLQRVFDRLFWDFSDSASTANKVWSNYITSIASPAKLEVKISIETMSSISEIIGFLYKRWDHGIISSEALPPLIGSEGSHKYLQSIQIIISTAISGLGIFSFTEKLLAMSQSNFITITDPYQYPLNERQDFRSPIYYLLHMFTRPCIGLEYDILFTQVIDMISRPFFEARKTLISKLAFVLGQYSTPVKVTCLTASLIIWKVFSKYLVSAIDESVSNLNMMRDAQHCNIYSKIVEVLRVGIEISPLQPFTEWTLLFESTLNLVTSQFGCTGRSLAVLEPLAKILCEEPSESLYLIPLISRMEYPKDLETFEMTRTRLLGIEKSKSETTSFNPYHYVYEYLRTSLKLAYSSNHESYDVISSTNSLLSRCPTQLKLDIIHPIKDMISLWINDEKSRVNCELLEEAVISLWSSIASILTHTIISFDQRKILTDFENLICSGLKSKNKRIVEITVEMCEAIFKIFANHLDNLKHLKDVFSQTQLTIFQPEQLSPTTESTEKVVKFKKSYQLDEQNFDIVHEKTPAKIGISSQSSSSNLKRTKTSTPQVVIKTKKQTSYPHKSRSTPWSLRAKKVVPSSNNYYESSIPLESTSLTSTTDYLDDSQISNISKSHQSNKEENSKKKILGSRIKPSNDLNKQEFLAEKYTKAQTKSNSGFTQLSLSFGVESISPMSSRSSSKISTIDTVENLGSLSPLPGSDKAVYDVIPSLTPNFSLTSNPCTNENLRSRINFAASESLESFLGDNGITRNHFLESISQKSQSPEDVNQFKPNPQIKKCKSSSGVGTNKVSFVATKRRINEKFLKEEDIIDPKSKNGKVYDLSYDESRIMTPEVNSLTEKIPNEKISTCSSTQSQDENENSTTTPGVDFKEKAPDEEIFTCSSTQSQDEDELFKIDFQKIVPNEHSNRYDITSSKLSSIPNCRSFKSLSPAEIILEIDKSVSSPVRIRNKSNIPGSFKNHRKGFNFLKDQNLEKSEKSVHSSFQKSKEHHSLSLKVSCLSKSPVDPKIDIDEDLYKESDIKNCATLASSFDQSLTRDYHLRTAVRKRKISLDDHEDNLEQLGRKRYKSKRRRILEKSINEKTTHNLPDNPGNSVNSDLSRNNESFETEKPNLNQIAIENHGIRKKKDLTSLDIVYDENPQKNNISYSLRKMHKQAHPNNNSSKKSSSGIEAIKGQNKRHNRSSAMINDFEKDNKNLETAVKMYKRKQSFTHKIKPTNFDNQMITKEQAEREMTPSHKRRFCDAELVTENPDSNYFTQNTSPDSCESIINTIDLLITKITGVHLVKEDVSKIEDKMMDAKRALYEAERRGHGSRQN
ncbi:putative telomere length regulator protein [Golovinomyces cichoracearum]|uniref:Putative telomere length regulator protein n=1 Tax=Golovinomyces cichoracearum TaxID=62708 RepID=A0A420H211_9PEZI|nr:putative telomere length regulator protein [Golovinomyces cichoracearum]